MWDWTTVGSEKTEKAKRTNDKLAEFKQEVEEKFVSYWAEIEWNGIRIREANKMIDKLLMKSIEHNNKILELNNLWMRVCWLLVIDVIVFCIKQNVL